jgi:cyclopropane fatty-acyl-phospholipid synthase-like methyltransferase
MSKFASEAYRLLKPGGLLVLTAHFSTNDRGYEATKKSLPTVAQNIDRMIPIKDVRNAFTTAGFTEIKTESIGQHVFKGFDHWISQVEDASWAHNIYRLYMEGHIDYYVLVLQKK